jgi:hypothetical protein
MSGLPIDCGRPITADRGAIDWDWLEREHRATMQRLPDGTARAAAVLSVFRGRAVYLASPAGSYAAAGAADIPLYHAVEWQAALLAEGVSPISPVLLGLGPVCGLAEGRLKTWLGSMPRDWWLRRREPWLAACAALVAVPCSGWHASECVWAEARWMLERGRPVFIPGPPP